MDKFYGRLIERMDKDLKVDNQPVIITIPYTNILTQCVDSDTSYSSFNVSTYDIPTFADLCECIGHKVITEYELRPDEYIGPIKNHELIIHISDSVWRSSRDVISYRGRPCKIGMWEDITPSQWICGNVSLKLTNVDNIYTVGIYLEKCVLG